MQIFMLLKKAAQYLFEDSAKWHCIIVISLGLIYKIAFILKTSFKVMCLVQFISYVTIPLIILFLAQLLE